LTLVGRSRPGAGAHRRTTPPCLTAAGRQQARPPPTNRAATKGSTCTPFRNQAGHRALGTEQQRNCLKPGAVDCDVGRLCPFAAAGLSKTATPSSAAAALRRAAAAAAVSRPERRGFTARRGWGAARVCARARVCVVELECMWFILHAATRWKLSTGALIVEFKLTFNVHYTLLTAARIVTLTPFRSPQPSPPPLLPAP
jgi:hypothetical protein